MMDSMTFRRALAGTSMASLFLMAFLCVGQSSGGVAASGLDRRLAASWRCYSQRLFYDRGGAGAVNGGASHELVLREDGTWVFGQSHGRWAVRPIQEADWKRWNTRSYGPVQKIVLEGWSGQTVAGPIEVDKSRKDHVNFFWLIYHIDKPDPGTVQMKFGHVNADLKAR